VLHSHISVIVVRVGLTHVIPKLNKTKKSDISRGMTRVDDEIWHALVCAHMQ